MPNWGEVLKEIIQYSNDKGVGLARSADDIRKEYLKKLNEYSQKNIISYYSGWLQNPGIEGTDINDDDKNGFMMAIHGMDCSRGLDLILHTPGGGVTATESIIDYLHRKFGDNIRILVPQIAMSAGTMIACSGKEIVMGKQSNLGPIDPQFRGVPAHGVVEEFKRAFKEIKKDPAKLSVWQFILQKYNPTFLTECENAIALSEEFVLQNLEKVMFKNDKDKKNKALKVVKYLTAYKDRKAHARHINIDECKKMGLKIVDLESDQQLQDLVLTVHHCYMHTLGNTNTLKVIENHSGATMARMFAMQ